MGLVLGSLERVYGDGEAAVSLRITEHGLWHATPLDVLAGAVAAMRESGLFQGVRVVFDAGAGDGRVLAAMTLASAAPRVVGIECDESLVREAESRFERLPAPRPRIVAGDFFEARSWTALGVDPSEVDLVVNYPDGNEKRLFQWASVRGARLAILTPASDPGLGECAVRLEVRTASTTWRVFVFESSR